MSIKSKGLKSDYPEDNQEEQLDLPEMPPASPVGKAARAYMAACDALTGAVGKLKEKKGLAKQALISELAKISKTSVVVDGYTFTAVHIEEQDDIKIKKPKING